MMFKKITQHVMHLMVPPFCTFCRRFLSERIPLCDVCHDRIKPINSVDIQLGGATSMKVYAVGAYEDPLKPLILAKNYGSKLPSKQLAELMVQHLPFNRIECDYFVPIPLHWTRYAQRGFNQSYAIGAVLSKKFDKPVVEILKRNKRTPFQSLFKPAERMLNVMGVFDIQHASLSVEGKHLVLIDDLMTTGATLASAGRALRTLKPASITAVVACRTL